MPSLFLPTFVRALLAVTILITAPPAHAADKFKVTGVECEMSWQWKHTPVIHYDIIDERRGDYQTNPGADYFRGAAERTAEFCDRTSRRPETPLAPPRQIRGIWFQSNGGEFKILFDLDRTAVDMSVGIVNTIGDKFAADKQVAARQQAALEEIRTRDARASEVEAAKEKAAQDKRAAEAARESAFFGSKGVQLSRLGTEVVPANFAFIADVRNNPFHFRKLGLAVVRTQFNKMVTDKLALFGNEFAPIFLHIDDVDRFTRSGETVMLAFKVIERGEVERSYGSLPELVMSALKSEPIFGDYVGAYTCPADDCGRIFDPPPPT